MQREDREMIFSKRVRAGKRTYFFDVRATRSNDYYLTVTESRRQQRDGEFIYEKSKLFVYKEDFNKFVEALQETVDHIKEELLPEFDYDQYDNQEEESSPEVAAKKDSNQKDDTPDEKEDVFSNSELKWE
ncbi:MAG: PUR family DNA/RNA-binding protein [Cytophagales bacterium]|nr:PUR family DNA/RNA-binding protein [Cytophagales bacterium]